jgi:hypothetical protein
MTMTFHFKIQILEIESPAVWRRLLVPDNFSFHHFHRIIQAAFGWSDIHLYEFAPKGLGSEWVIAHPDTEPETAYNNSTRYKLRDYFERKGEKLIYTYDYGDCWEHLITFENVTVDLSKRATCIDGGGATPPENCGGTTGYEEFKLAVNDPIHKDYIRTREWSGITEGEHWDVHAFNKERTVRILKSM